MILSVAHEFSLDFVSKLSWFADAQWMHLLAHDRTILFIVIWVKFRLRPCFSVGRRGRAPPCNRAGHRTRIRVQPQSTQTFPPQTVQRCLSFFANVSLHWLVAQVPPILPVIADHDIIPFAAMDPSRMLLGWSTPWIILDIGVSNVAHVLWDIQLFPPVD